MSEVFIMKKRRCTYVQNPYMKQIRDLFIVTSCSATYTFFKIGKKRYIHSSYDGLNEVFHILDLEKKEVEVSKTFSNSNLIQALEVEN